MPPDRNQTAMLYLILIFNTLPSTFVFKDRKLYKPPDATDASDAHQNPLEALRRSMGIKCKRHDSLKGQKKKRGSKRQKRERGSKKQKRRMVV